MRTNKKFYKLSAWIFILIIGIVFFIIFTANAGNNFKRKNKGSEYVEGEVLVKFKESTMPSAALAMVNNLGCMKIRDISKKEPLLLVQIKDQKTVEDAVKMFMSDPNVEYAQPNYIYRALTTIPNDSEYGNLWGLKNIGQYISDSDYGKNNPGTYGMDMDIELAWDAIKDCSSVIVAVIDTGVNYNHVDLSDNMWSGATFHGYDYVDNDNTPFDYNGHGTHCAGIIGAVGNNSIGTCGVCWSVQIMAVRVLDASGYGTTANIISGIYYAVDNGANVLSMSLGGGAYDQAYYNTIKYARDNGVLVVAAAGNDGFDNDGGIHTYPCDFSLDNIVGVAALDQSYELADFSNYGAYSVDVGAPGTNIMSEWCGTETHISDSLTSGWSEGGTLGWAYVVRDLGFGNVNLLANPSTWGPPSWGYYSSYANDRIWKTFDLSSSDVAVLNYYTWFDVESGYDAFYTNCDNGSGDPFVSGIQLAGWTGDTGGYFVTQSFEIPSSYRTSTCTIGFRLYSDNIVQHNGIAIAEFSIKTTSLNDFSYKTINGTSMATPYVSGVAALIWALNPTYDYLDVIDALTYGGEPIAALSGKTTTGKAVNAWGSVKYIKKPTGVTITK